MNWKQACLLPVLSALCFGVGALVGHPVIGALVGSVFLLVIATIGFMSLWDWLGKS